MQSKTRISDVIINSLIILHKKWVKFFLIKRIPSLFNSGQEPYDLSDNNLATCANKQVATALYQIQFAIFLRSPVSHTDLAQPTQVYIITPFTPSRLYLYSCFTLNFLQIRQRQIPTKPKKHETTVEAHKLHPQTSFSTTYQSLFLNLHNP